MAHRKIEVVLTSTDKIALAGPVDVTGWGDGGSEVQAVGQIAEIRVSLDGESQFGLHIGDDGLLCITSYEACYQAAVPTNLTLEPTRPWKAAEPKRRTHET